MKRIILYTSILVVLAGGFILFRNNGFSMGLKREDPKTVAVTNKISVQVQKAKTVEKMSGATYKATLEPNEEGIVNSKISGKVVRILFDNGKHVSQGEPLIVLDDQDVRNQLKSAENQLAISENQLAASQATLQKLEANLKTVQLNYDRTKALFSQGAVPQSSFDDAELALKTANADYESGKINIETSKASINASKISIDTLNDSLENTIIKAPIDGIMDEKSVNIGQMASQGAALAKVKDISYINAVIQVEQENINNIKLGQKATVKLNNGNNETFEGIVKSIDVSADPNARVFNCKIQLDNKSQSLHPGVFAKVEIIGDQKMQVITVPLEALAGNEGNYYVFVNNNETASKHSVTIGETSDNTVEIKSGVQKGDDIICTNVNTLQDGDKVTVVSE